jgi:hypothetical protein
MIPAGEGSIGVLLLIEIRRIPAYHPILQQKKNPSG